MHSHRVHVATKVPPRNRLWPARTGIGIEQVFPYDYIIHSTDESLHNLKMDTIDLQQLHVWNPEWLERDDWRRAFEELKTSGKVRAVGVSINDHEPDTALDLIRTGCVDAVQVIYNIFDQSPVRNLFALAQEKNVGVIARVPFDEGSLTGAITEQTVFDPKDFRSSYFRGDRKKQVVERVAALEKDLAGVGASLAEIALQVYDLASGGIHRHTRDADREERRKERGRLRQGAAGFRDARPPQASCVGEEFL